MNRQCLTLYKYLCLSCYSELAVQYTSDKDGKFDLNKSSVHCPNRKCSLYEKKYKIPLGIINLEPLD